MRKILEHQVRALERLRYKLRSQQTLAAAEEALGLPQAFLRKTTHQLKDVLHEGRLRPGVDLSIFLAVAEYLGEDPREFLDEVLDPHPDGGPSPVERFRSLAEGRPAPAILDAVLKEPRATPAATEAELDAVDELRYDDPQAALRRCKKLAPRVPAVFAPTLLGIYGSCLRCRHRHRDAAAAIMAAFRLAAGLEAGPAIFGDLMQRAGVVAAYRGRFPLSLALADAALVQHACAGNSAGEASSMVDRAIALFRLERVQDSLDPLKAAKVRLLNESGPRAARNLFIVHLQLALCFFELGRPSASDKAAKSARSVIEGIGAELTSQLLWLEARLFRSMDRAADAEGKYRELIDRLRNRLPMDAALAGAELVEMLVDLDRADDALKAALSLFALLDSLQSKHPSAARALHELLRIATSRQRVDPRALEAAIRAFKGDAGPGRAPRS